MDMSILEFVVYVFVTYFTLAILITSLIKEVNETRYATLARIVFILPAIITSGILVFSGTDISLDTIRTTTETWNNQTSTLIFTEFTDTTDKFVLINPVWSMVNFIIFMTFIIYTIKQVLLMLGVGKEKP